MTSTNVANLIPDPAVSSWCWLSGVCSPTVLLSKIKLYGSAKENCQHYGKTAGWHTLLERARHWSMTETAWCSRSRLAWRDGLFFSHNSCLSPKCATTNLHIVTRSETEKPTRGSCLLPSWGKDWILGKKKRGDPRATKGRNVAWGWKINDGASLTGNSEWNWILKSTSKWQRGSTRLIATFFLKIPQMFCTYERFFVKF